MRMLLQKSQDVSKTYKNGNTTFGINQIRNVRMNGILGHVRVTAVGVQNQ